MKSQNTKSERQYLSALMAVLVVSGLFGVNIASSSATSFPDDSLLRSADGKVFVVRQGQKVKINSLDDLRRNFRGKKINNVDDKTLASIPDSRGGNSSGKMLVRTPDGKIFEIKNGQRRPVSTLSELSGKFRNVPISNIDSATLNKYPLSNSGSSSRAFDDNSLVRTSKGQIFAVRGSSLRKVSSLTELRREHAGKVIHNVSNDDLIARGVKLRGDGSIDDNSSISRSSSNDIVNGVKLRGDGTIDDNLPRHSGQDDIVNGVKLRGDGSVDDNSADSGRNRGGDSGSGSGRGNSSDD